MFHIEQSYIVAQFNDAFRHRHEALASGFDDYEVGYWAGYEHCILDVMRHASVAGEMVSRYVACWRFFKTWEEIRRRRGLRLVQ